MAAPAGRTARVAAAVRAALPDATVLVVGDDRLHVAGAITVPLGAFAERVLQPELERAQERTRVEKMDAICREHKVPLAAVALQFSMRDPRITSTIVGVSKPERIQQTIDLAGTPIPDEIWARLDAVGYRLCPFVIAVFFRPLDDHDPRDTLNAFAQGTGPGCGSPRCLRRQTPRRSSP